MPDYEVWLTDKNLNVLGSPLVNWKTIDATLRFNEPGSGLFTVPAYSSVRDIIGAGTRVAILWRPAKGLPREPLIAGPVEDVLHERGDDGEHAGAGTLTINFADDLAKMAGKVTYAETAVAPESWAVDYWTYSGEAETGIRRLALENAGSSALTARQIPKLVGGNIAGVTASITISTRLEPLLDALRTAAIAAGGVGFRTRQVRDNIYFEVYQPANRTSTVVYSFELRNVRYLAYRQTSPSGTTALVGGQGEGADRYVLSRTYTPDETAWGQSEIYVPRAGSATTLELQAEGDKALLDTRATAQLTATTIDSASQRYGVHYFLGDTVSISPAPGTRLAAQVKTVHVQAWATAGELITPTIGDQGLTTDQGMIKRLRDMDKRLRYLEGNTLPIAP